MRWVRRWIGVALIAALLVAGWRLAHENGAHVTVSYLVDRIELPLWEALLIFFGAGFALAGCGWLWRSARAQILERRYRKAISGLESEIHQLRNLPLQTHHDAPAAPAGGGGEPARAVRWGS